MKKRSFFERLSGSIPVDDFDAYDDDVLPAQSVRRIAPDTAPIPASQAYASVGHAEEDSEGQLPVDVYQTPNEIVIRTFIAGVRADDINLSISRDMVVIEGSRQERESIIESDYYTRELFWGTFSRTILLAQEVDVDTCTAASKDGLLTITLPKLDKARQTKLKVRAG
jgi:HSP20 family molecular chaperone IbpA